jgi:hypothetical protein
MYKIIFFFKRLKENEENNVIRITGMTFRLTRRSKNIRKKTGIRKMGRVSNYQRSGNVLTEYVKMK